MEKISPSIDLERSELRYIFYMYDLPDILEDFEKIGFEQKIYRDTPVTRTVYFGSKIGFKPGLSIKARIYSPTRVPIITRMSNDEKFNVLEIKSTLDYDDIFFLGLQQDQESQKLVTQKFGVHYPRDIIYSIQKASEDGLLQDSTFKSKSRLRKQDLIGAIGSNLTLNEIVTILCKPSNLDYKLSDQLKQLLNTKIRPLKNKTLIPFVMTQYNRIHLIPKEKDWRSFIRVTIDPGVEYYNTYFNYPEDFVDNSSVTAEYLTRERFCRLEFKIDPASIQNNRKLANDITDILHKYGCIAFISKKWKGATTVSDRYIRKQYFWREPIGKIISGFFPVDESWFKFGNITAWLYTLIKRSKTFNAYDDEPHVLVKNQNYIKGFVGLPVPSLTVIIEGPYIRYHIPPKSNPIHIKKPEFYITEEYNDPVRYLRISSKKELDNSLHSSISIEGYSFFRSYGFLVVHKESQRVYKLTIERNTKAQGGSKTYDLYCKMRYLGTREYLYEIEEKEITSELKTFYKEFAPIMSEPFSPENLELDLYDGVLSKEHIL